MTAARKTSNNPNNNSNMILIVDPASESSRSLDSTSSTRATGTTAATKQHKAMNENKKDIPSTPQSPTTVIADLNTTAAAASTVTAAAKRQHIVKPKNRSVTFQSVVVVQPILHVYDYTDREFHRCWYSPRDYKRFRHDNHDALRKAKELQYDGRICIRGLEGGAKRRSNKQRARDAVLEEQELQQEEGIVDQELMADVYYGYSYSCQVEAHMKGLKDEADIRRYYR